MSEKKKPEYIYLLVSDDYPNLVKIGKSKNPQQREKEINSAATNIKTFYICYYQEVKNSQICENQLHAAFDYFIADAEKVQAKVGLKSKPEEFFAIDWRIARAALLCMKTAETLATKPDENSSSKIKRECWMNIPLMKESVKGNIKTVEEVLNNSKTDIDIQAISGRTALMWSIEPSSHKYYVDEQKSNKENDPECHRKITEQILNKNPDIELTTDNGKTALMIAAKHGKDYAVKMLLDAGAKKDVKCHGGWTALDYALAYEHKTDAHEKIISLLRE